MLLDVTQATLCTVSLTLEWWKGCLLAEVSDVIESCNGLWNNCREHSHLVDQQFTLRRQILSTHSL